MIILDSVIYFLSKLVLRRGKLRFHCCSRLIQLGDQCAALISLLALGIDHADINRRLFMSKSRNQIRAEGFVASKMRTVADGKIAYASLSSAECESLGLDISDFETAIDVVRSLIGAEVAFVVKDTNRGFKASMRSTGANVAKIAARHGGGGHVRAAGCNVDAKNVEEAAEILLSELEALF